MHRRIDGQPVYLRTNERSVILWVKIGGRGVASSYVPNIFQLTQSCLSVYNNLYKYLLKIGGSMQTCDFNGVVILFLKSS